MSPIAFSHLGGVALVHRLAKSEEVTARITLFTRSTGLECEIKDKIDV